MEGFSSKRSCGSEDVSPADDMTSLESNVTALQATVAALEEANANDATAGLGMWLLLSAVNIVFMQAGFALLEFGSLRSKHGKSILFKNMCDFAFGTLAWYSIGFGIAGPGASGASGHDYGSRDSDNFLALFHSMSFAVTAATIVSGAVAERMSLAAYLLQTFILVAFLYALIVSWCWDADGWLAKDYGFVDFAGSGVVHLCGGSAALAQCVVLGPRTLRFMKDEDDEKKVTVANFKGHSPSSANLGTYILLAGWVSFNASSTLDASALGLEIAARCAVTTVMSGSMSLASVLVYQMCVFGTCDLSEANNALLAGLVAITASCAYVDVWAALLIGMAACFIYKGVSAALIKLQIDDPLDAIPIHGANGIWGLLATAAFAKGELLDSHFARADHDGNHQGFLYGGDGSLLQAQLLGCVVIILIAGVPIACFGLILRSIKQKGGGSYLRVNEDAELLGLDFKYHEGSAYPELTAADVLEHNLVHEAEQRNRAKSFHPMKPGEKTKGHRPSTQSRRRTQNSAKSTAPSEASSTQADQGQVGNTGNSITKGDPPGNRLKKIAPEPVPVPPGVPPV
eukprot:scaffold718_cov252-Pinguiococcus_pyrenoidosus.AAC.4